MVRVFFTGIMGKWGDVTSLSVTSFSAYTSGARGLKFGRNNHHLLAQNLPFRFLIFCLEAEIYLSLKLCNEFS